MRTRTSIFFLVMAAAWVTSCAGPQVVLTRTPSAPAPPAWLGMVPEDPVTLYFVGSCSSADTLEAARTRAMDHALAEIATYLGTTIESLIRERSTDRRDTFEHQITARTAARVLGATVADHYYVTIHRQENHVAVCRYEYHVLLSYAREAAQTELARRRKEETAETEMAATLYRQADKLAAGRELLEAGKLLKQAQKKLQSLSTTVGIAPAGFGSAADLHLAVNRLQENVTGSLRSAAFVDASQPPEPAFQTALKAPVLEAGYRTSATPFFRIESDVTLTSGGQALNAAVVLISGEVRAIRLRDKATLVTLPVQSKGFHRDPKRAAQQAAATGGKKVGAELAERLRALE